MALSLARALSFNRVRVAHQNPDPDQLRSDRVHGRLHRIEHPFGQGAFQAVEFDDPSGSKQGIDEPSNHGAFLEDDIRTEKHVGLQRNALAIGVDIGAIERSDCLVGGLFELDSVRRQSF
jgi:hypothetical protein